MKIFYSPLYNGNYYMEMNGNIAIDVQVLETQGLLTQLALHAGIHVEIPPYPSRLIAYYQALSKYDKSHPDNIFHRSFVIDGMSVSKKLLLWRDSLTLAGWNEEVSLDDCKRLNTLADIEKEYKENSLSTLLCDLKEKLKLMQKGGVNIPIAFKELEIVLPCSIKILPDYIKPILELLSSIGTKIIESVVDEKKWPQEITEIQFSQQWKADAWLSQQQASDYDVWVSTDNKRMDNWLHMSGKPVSGSAIHNSNPQITQLFLIAVQLFQRPLNVNTLLQYLYLPECPLNWILSKNLSKVIVKEGGFCNDKVLECIKTYIETAFKEEKEQTTLKTTPADREDNYKIYLPFDVRNMKEAVSLALECDDVDAISFNSFMTSIKKYASLRAEALDSVDHDDARINQLRMISTLIDALNSQIKINSDEKLSFKKIQQWAKSLYDSSDYNQYNPQIGARFVVESPACMIGNAQNTIWCDFYGDVSFPLSTDFLSHNEQEELRKKFVLLWNRDNEIQFQNLSLKTPLHHTKQKLVLITCVNQGVSILPKHPLYFQLPEHVFIKGDDLYANMLNKEIFSINNHSESDDREIIFDAERHPITWRKEESYSSLEKLLQDPFDYFMNYILGFSDLSATEINLYTTNGNVAHETIEDLFTAERGNTTLANYVSQNYENAFSKALSKKGALLLLPEHHLDKDRLMHQLRRSVNKLAEIIQANKLTVVKCEQEEKEDIGFENKIVINGYIDMLLKDKEGKDVIFDLKWTTKGDKFKKILKQNRDAQLAIYKTLLQKRTQHSEIARTAFFVMPEGILFTTDTFEKTNCEQITPRDKSDLIGQLRLGYQERKKEISNGVIETADLVPVRELHYGQQAGVYPLKQKGVKMKDADGKEITIQVKEENKYSDYKCFTL